MFNNLNPKCANPACPTTYHWTTGGKFFRFHPADSLDTGGVATGHLENTHHVEHYWLCEPCSKVLRLAYSAQKGLEVRPLWPELTTAEGSKELAAA